MRSSVVLCVCLLVSVCGHSETRKDVRLHMDEQTVFEEDGTYQQPKVVIRRSSHKNNLNFNADRLEGREPPTRPGINALIRDDREEERRRRREELESNDIVQRYVGDADEENKTRVYVSPRTNAYRAPNKAKPLKEPKRRYIGLTPDYNDADQVRIDAPRNQVHTKGITQVHVGKRQFDNRQSQTVNHSIKQANSTNRGRSGLVGSTSAGTEGKVYTGVARSRPQRVEQPKGKLQQDSSSVKRFEQYQIQQHNALQQQLLQKQQQSISKNNGQKPVYPQRVQQLPTTGASSRLGASGSSTYLYSKPKGAQPRLPTTTEQLLRRSEGAAYRLGQSSSGYPSIGSVTVRQPEKKQTQHRVLENGHGERLIIRDVVVPEPVYQQRLIRSDDEYLNVAPPEFWEQQDQQLLQQVETVAPSSAEVEYVSLIGLPVLPVSQFDQHYVWGTESLSEDSPFAFGLPWHYLSRGWQIPPMTNDNARFAFLWFVVDLHQTTRDAFKLRLDALESEVYRASRKRKLELLEAWTSEFSDELMTLPKADQLIWEQQKQRLSNELSAFPLIAQAGLTVDEQKILNQLEQVELGSLEDLIYQYRQTSLEYRFQREYYQRLRQPGYGMATRLSSSEFDALLGQEEEMKQTFLSLKSQIERLQLMMERYTEYSERVDYLRQQSVLENNQSARSELVNSMMGLLEQEEALLIQRLRAYRDVWLIGWYTNQFATWVSKK